MGVAQFAELNDLVRELEEVNPLPSPSYLSFGWYLYKSLTQVKLVTFNICKCQQEGSEKLMEYSTFLFTAILCATMLCLGFEREVGGMFGEKGKKG